MGDVSAAMTAGDYDAGDHGGGGGDAS